MPAGETAGANDLDWPGGELISDGVLPGLNGVGVPFAAGPDVAGDGETSGESDDGEGAGVWESGEGAGAWPGGAGVGGDVLRRAKTTMTNFWPWSQLVLFDVIK